MARISANLPGHAISDVRMVCPNGEFYALEMRLSSDQGQSLDIDIQFDNPAFAFWLSEKIRKATLDAMNPNQIDRLTAEMLMADVRELNLPMPSVLDRLAMGLGLPKDE